MQNNNIWFISALWSNRKNIWTDLIQWTKTEVESVLLNIINVEQLPNKFIEVLESNIKKKSNILDLSEIDFKKDVKSYYEEQKLINKNALIVLINIINTHDKLKNRRILRIWWELAEFFTAKLPQIHEWIILGANDYWIFSLNKDTSIKKLIINGGDFTNVLFEAITYISTLKSLNFRNIKLIDNYLDRAILERFLEFAVTKKLKIYTSWITIDFKNFILPGSIYDLEEHNNFYIVVKK